MQTGLQKQPETTETTKEKEVELWDADPDCKHEYDKNLWSGVRCLKCGGWFCY